jgi:hypothetical protein
MWLSELTYNLFNTAPGESPPVVVSLATTFMYYLEADKLP